MVVFLKLENHRILAGKFKRLFNNCFFLFNFFIFSDCGSDPTCVLCSDCFLNSKHRSHKYKVCLANLLLIELIQPI